MVPIALRRTTGQATGMKRTTRPSCQASRNCPAWSLRVSGQPLALSVIAVAMALTLLAVTAPSAPAVLVPAPHAGPSQSLYRGLNPARLLDTRPGSPTIDAMASGSGPVGQGQTLDLAVAGRGGVPSIGAGAVVLNVTATDAPLPTYLTVWPSGTPRPLASNLNIASGQTIPNLVIAKLGSDGHVSIYNNSGNIDII